MLALTMSRSFNQKMDAVFATTIRVSQNCKFVYILKQENREHDALRCMTIVYTYWDIFGGKTTHI